MGRRIADARLYDAEWMRSAYATATIEDLAAVLQTSTNTVLRWLIKHRIARRPSGVMMHARGKTKA